MNRKIEMLILALFMQGINNLAMGEGLALPNREAVERLVRVEEGQKRLEEGQKVLSDRLTKVEEGQKELLGRLIKVEEGQKASLVKFEEGQKALLIKFEEGQKATNIQLKSLDKRIDDLKDLIYVLLAGILALIAFVLWDRRSTISPLTKKTEELNKRNDLLLDILKEYARKEPKMAEVLKSLGLL